jgi:hypothetical protein
MISSVTINENEDHRERSFPNFTYKLGALHSNEPSGSCKMLLACTTRINLWNTKRNLLYIRNQSVPRCKRFPPQLHKPSSFYYFLCFCSPARAMASSFTRFRDHTQRRTTVGRTPLDEWSARRRDLYLTTHTTRKNVHAPGGIRTHDRSRRSAVDLRLRSCDHWDRQTKQLIVYKGKVAVRSKIRTKHSTQSQHHVESLNVKNLVERKEIAMLYEVKCPSDPTFLEARSLFWKILESRGLRWDYK